MVRILRQPIKCLEAIHDVVSKVLYKNRRHSLVGIVADGPASRLLLLIFSDLETEAVSTYKLSSVLSIGSPLSPPKSLHFQGAF